MVKCPKLETIARGFFKGYKAHGYKTVGDRARFIFCKMEPDFDKYRELFINKGSGKIFISEDYTMKDFHSNIYGEINPVKNAYTIATEKERTEIIALQGYEVEAFYPTEDFHYHDVVIIGLRKQGSLICRDLLVYPYNGDVQISDEYSLADFPRDDLPYFL